MDYYFSKRISELQPSAIREILKATQDPSIIPFAAGNPDASSFPVDEIKKILFYSCSMYGFIYLYYKH